MIKMDTEKRSTICFGLFIIFQILTWIFITTVYSVATDFEILVKTKLEKDPIITGITLALIMGCVFGWLIPTIPLFIILCDSRYLEGTTRKIRKEERKVLKMKCKVIELTNKKKQLEQAKDYQLKGAKLNCEIKQLELEEVEQFKICDCGAKLPLYACYCHKCGYHIS